MLIQTDQELRSYLPNVFATCDGEVSLFDKLNFFLSNSERWLAAYFVGDTHLATISSSSGSPLRSLCCQIVVADAFHGALPSLDLVLTPNGFGIVSNNNVAPASADRVNRLGDALIANRDQLLTSLLLSLAEDNAWRESEQGQYFAATLWPDLHLATMCGYTSEKWEHYRTLRNALITIERELAEKYISDVLYSRFRQHFLSRSMTVQEKPIIDTLRSLEVELLQGKPLNYSLLMSLVQQIRSDTTHFAEWQTSATAQLYQLPQFENKKKSTAFWW
ncbi:MAG: hypothetical protein MJZ82_03060 [Paludibacteraceae bacterium]|nr:hypothetical protein [Paludibacteraceae bacterium]